jgi:hypothetical protein
MHGEGVVLEVEFQEVGIEEYTQFFLEALKSRFGKELSEERLSILAQAIEESRIAGQAPVDLAENLSDNWSLIFD